MFRFPAKERSKWGSIQLDSTLLMDGDDGPHDGPLALSVVLSWGVGVGWRANIFEEYSDEFHGFFGYSM